VDVAESATAKPDGIVLGRDRDLEGRDNEIWVRRILFALLPLVAVLALLNVFGQRPQQHVVSSPGASLEVNAPARMRSGLFGQARITVRAQRTIPNAVLVLDPGWFESVSMNTIEPAPKDESSVDGKPSFALGKLAAGDTYTLFMEYQVNPTNVGRRSQDVALYDGGRKLLEVNRTFTVFP
jgi:hypothetical protein